MQFAEINTPPMPHMRTWGARSSHYQFVISLSTDPRDPEWCGYHASWKDRRLDLRPFGKQPVNRIDGAPWPTFKQAEQACKDTLKQLKQRH